MAVRINTEALLDTVPPMLLESDRKLLVEDRVGRLEQMGGGVQAVIRTSRGSASSEAGSPRSATARTSTTTCVDTRSP